MPGADRSTERAILHVTSDRVAGSSEVQCALIETGRPVLVREDLLRAMGAVAASERGVGLEAIVVASELMGPGDDEFFRFVAGRRTAPPIYRYGDDAEHCVGEKCRSASRRIAPEMVASLFGGVSRVPLAAEPASAADRPAVIPEESRQRDSFDTVREDLTGREGEISHEIENDAANKEVAAGAVEPEIPPVPWRPNPFRPVRVPPGRQAPPAVASQGGSRPLLSPEELDALLNSRVDYPDSAEETA